MPGGQKEEGIGLLTGESPVVVPKSGAGTAASAPSAPPSSVVKPEAPQLLTFKAADDTLREVTAGTVTTLSAVLTSNHQTPGNAIVNVDIAYTSTYPGEGAEWPVSWLPPGKKSFAELVARSERSKLPLSPAIGVPFAFEVTALVLLIAIVGVVMMAGRKEVRF